MQLRPYQEEALAAVYEHLRGRDDNPCVVIPTGGGKTAVMATICRDAVRRWGGRVIILAHVKELLEQTVGNVHEMASDLWADVGVYSAGLKSRDTEHPIIVAGIQSVYKRACEIGAFDLVMVDEAHMIPPDGEGMYRQFLADMQVINPHVRVVGLTATPYRMKSGIICAPDHFLNAICYEISVRELIVQGYLSPLTSKATIHTVDTSGLHVRGGEFVAGETAALMGQERLVRAACGEILSYTRDRKSVLIFAAGVEHGQHLARVLREKSGADVGEVYGDTLAAWRQQTLGQFKAGELKYLVNVNVLTTGFDAPNVDCVAIVRPTMSPGLYYQMVGRGFRLADGKSDCLVLDFGGNILRHGPVDMVRPKAVVGSGDGEAPAKECPECHSVVAAGYARCPDCGFEFPEPERPQHDAKASDAGVLSDQLTFENHDVIDVFYAVHKKRHAPPDHPKTMRVEYMFGLNDTVSEWVCPEHTGFARGKFEQWWRARSNAPLPATAAEAVALAEAGAIAETESIKTKRAAGEKWPQVVAYRLGTKPPWRDRAPGEDDDEPAPVGGVGTPDEWDVPF